MGKNQMTNKDRSLIMLHTDMVFSEDPEFKAIAEEYAIDNNKFLTEFRDAWIKLVNADRYGDVCLHVPTDDNGKIEIVSDSKVSFPQLEEDTSEASFKDLESDWGFAFLVTAALLILTWVSIGCLFFFVRKQSQNPYKKFSVNSRGSGDAIMTGTRVV